MTGFTRDFTLDGPSVSAAAEQAQEFLEAEGVDLRAAHHATLALDELLTNAATHGGGAGRPASLHLRVTPDCIEVQIVDAAEPYDPRLQAAPDTSATVDERPIGGLGVHLVMKLSRDLDYTRDNDRNRTSFRIARNRSEA